MIRRCLSRLVLCAVLASPASAQTVDGPHHRTTSVSVTLLDTLVQLPHEFLYHGTERLLTDSVVLARGVDYAMEYRFGRIRFTLPQLERLLGKGTVRVVSVSYEILPLTFQKEYTLHQTVVTPDSAGRQVQTIIPRTQLLDMDDLFGEGIQKSGSISRGFTVGSNRDLSINSGFRMQLSGRLSQDVEVVAALTDENTPIQPEGSTQTLREVDKVFVELRSEHYTATLGDFDLEQGPEVGGEFGRVMRRLQGARGTAAVHRLGGWNAGGQGSMTAATARGKFSTNQIQGTEGNQGPYRLTGRNGERRLLVIAGSERVYIDGNLMARGELDDYVIDYAGGEIVFTGRRLITNASRITVDFEYSDREYTRNLVGTSMSGQWGDRNATFNVSLVQEADDPDAPLETTLDEAMRGVLRTSGSDRLSASVSGISFVGNDSASGKGLGQYIVSDTVIGGRTVSILTYAPGDSLAQYSVQFSSVDRVPADSGGYVRVAAGHFRFAGLGQGSYLPVHLLPVPQLQRVVDVNTAVRVTNDLTMTGEYAASAFDRNRFSTLDDPGSSGGAYKIGLRYRPEAVKVGGMALGDVDLSLSERYVDHRFAPLDRTNEVEFDRKWNLESAGITNERIREASLQVRPSRAFGIEAGYGFLDRTGELRSTRWVTDLSAGDTGLPVLRYRREEIRSENVTLNDLTSWLRHRGTLEYVVLSLRTGLRVETEDRDARLRTNDSLRMGSYRYVETAPRIASAEWNRMSASAEVQWRSEDSAAGGDLRRAFSSVTQLYGWQLRDWNSLSSTLNLSHRRTRASEVFRARGMTDAEVILVRSQSRYTPLQRGVDSDVFYELSSQRSARFERVFVRVAQGTGSYRYLGDLNENGIADEEEFELVRFDGDYVVLYLPSDQLVPVVDVKAGVRVRLTPARWMHPRPSTTWEKALRMISTETTLRVEERSSDPDVSGIYLLNFSKFQSTQHTLTGSNSFTQDLYLFETSPDLSFRFRHAKRTGMTQLVGGVERSMYLERSVRMRSQLIPEIGNQTDFSAKLDRVTGAAALNRQRDLSSVGILTDFAYRPERHLEVGLVIGGTTIVDRLPDNEPQAGINEQAVRTVVAFPGSGQWRSEIRREEVVVTHTELQPNRPMPFEFTQGKTPGKSFLWQTAFDYRLTDNVQVTLQYNGRSESGRVPVHTARAEVRAFF